MSAPALATRPALSPRLVQRWPDGAQQWSVASASRPDVDHTVYVGPEGCSCSCESYTYRRACRHIDAALAAAQEVRMVSPTTTALVSYHAPTTPALPDGTEWATIVQMSKVLAGSGLMPSHVKTPEAAAAIILQGRELGIGAMQALRTIYLIEGRLTLSADLMAALIYARCGDRALQVVERTAERCVIDYQRPGWSAPARMTWTIAMAKTAGLSGRGTWQKHPDAMLYARCVSAIAHTAFQDVIAGLYTADEAEEIAESERPARPVVSIVDRDTAEFIDDTPAPTAADLSGKATPPRPASDRSVRESKPTGGQIEILTALAAWLAVEVPHFSTASQAAQLITAWQRDAADIRGRFQAAARALTLKAKEVAALVKAETGHDQWEMVPARQLIALSTRLEAVKAGDISLAFGPDGTPAFEYPPEPVEPPGADPPR